MQFENYFGAELSEEEMKIQTCIDLNDDLQHGHQNPKDYSNYLNFITIYMMLLSALFMIFFKTDMKRSKADEDSRERSKIVANMKDIEHVEQQEALVEPTA